MLTTFFKKKISDDQLATIFVNGILDVLDNCFSEMKALIQEDPAFVTSPDLADATDGHFAMILIVGNLDYLTDNFEGENSESVKKLIIEKFSVVFDLEDYQFEKHLENYQKFIAKVNHPSKNMLYGMSKAIFYKNELNQYQDDYFKGMNLPNPLFLKRLDDVIENFIWNWDSFFRKHKMVS